MEKSVTHLLSLVVLSIVVLGSLLPLTADCAAAAPESFVYPLLGTRVSSEFGMRKHPVLRYVRHHSGIDLAAPEGATIRAIAEGTVIYADPFGGYGNFVVVQHKNGLTSHYGHCATIGVSPGQKITAGAVLATVGKTGIVTGPHLHFEIRRNGIAEDPEKFLPGLALEGEG